MLVFKLWALFRTNLQFWAVIAQTKAHFGSQLSFSQPPSCPTVLSRAVWSAITLLAHACEKFTPLPRRSFGSCLVIPWRVPRWVDPPVTANRASVSLRILPAPSTLSPLRVYHFRRCSICLSAIWTWLLGSKAQHWITKVGWGATVFRSWVVSFLRKEHHFQGFLQANFWLDSACSSGCSSTSRFQHLFPSISGHIQPIPSRNCCYLLQQLLFLKVLASAVQSPSPSPATSGSGHLFEHYTVTLFFAQNRTSLTWTLALSSKTFQPLSDALDQSPWWAQREPSFKHHSQVQEVSELWVASLWHAGWCPLSYSHRITFPACIFRSTEASASVLPCRSTVLFAAPTALLFPTRPLPRASTLFRTIDSCCAWLLLRMESLLMIFFQP